MARTRLSSLSGLPTEAPGVVAALNFGGTSPARPFRCTAGSQRYGGGRLRQPCFLRKSGWEEKATLSSSAPQPEGEAGFARGRGCRGTAWARSRCSPTGTCHYLPVLSGRARGRGCWGPGGLLRLCQAGSGGSRTAGTHPTGPSATGMPGCRVIPWGPGGQIVAGGRGWGSAEAELGAPRFGGLPPGPRSSLPGAGSAGRTLVHPASPAQGQRKELFLFAGAVGSGTHRPCCGSVGPCRRRGDSPVADPGLCSGHGPAWAGEFPACRRLLLRQRNRLSLA